LIALPFIFIILAIAGYYGYRFYKNRINNQVDAQDKKEETAVIL
jgi:hypothetical protein